ncbi:MAG: hypothetical protein GF364_05670 [Candidatus Lokiarchaeota archaeon]|nr:hypothetical protein [Candidatus Lokiarchaeota archaeon]
MSDRMKKITLCFIFWLITLIISQNIGFIRAEDTQTTKYLEVGDYVKYSWDTKEAYIPYSASSIYMEIVDISNPDDVIINVSRRWEEDDVEYREALSIGISAGNWIVNNDTLINDWSTCPASIGNPSEIRTHWTETYLENVTELYYDVERTAVQLEYELDDVTINGYLHDVSVRWLWDKTTGVLLNNSVEFTNLDDPVLSGYFEQYLTETTLWSLDTSGIPGFPLEIMIPTLILGILFIGVKTWKNKEKREGK